MRKLLLVALLVGLPLAAAAQQRPLTTQEVETVPPGDVMVEFGFEFLQNKKFPLSGLEGDLTKVGVLDIHWGVSRAVEIQIQGTIRQFLSVSQQQPALVVPDLDPGENSTSDFGDFTLAVKAMLLPESRHRPALGVLFGFEMPNTDETQGIGLNTTNVFLRFLLQKRFGRLNLFGNVGLGILEAPTGNFTQNDVFLYGLGAVYPVHPQLNIVGEIAGRQSTRSTPANGPLAGTGSRSEARLGFQLFAGGYRWNFAGIAGLTENDADTGFFFGVSKRVTLYPGYQPTR